MRAVSKYQRALAMLMGIAIVVMLVIKILHDGLVI